MSESLEQFARGGADFTLALLEQLKASDGKDNILISPFSIQTCMALAFHGAKGETAKEMAKVLKYPSNSADELAESVNKIMSSLQGSDLVRIANKVYVQHNNPLKPDYMAAVKDKYLAESENVNFPEKVKTAKAMNSWVEEKTNGKIRDFIEAETLKNDMQFVLLNALHFKGQWQDQFDAAKSYKSDFWLNEKEAIQTDFMFQDEKFNFSYVEGLDCEALEMPYANSQLSMFILLPNERNGLADLATKLKQVNLLDLPKSMHKSYVFVRFPKFKLNYDVELSEVMKKMGLSQAFENGADFSNITDSPICISKIFHKASIEVNEEGTEAAVANGFMPRPMCMPPVFNANHPFFYWIWDRKTILFAGAFVNPAKAQ